MTLPYPSVVGPLALSPLVMGSLVVSALIMGACSEAAKPTTGVVASAEKESQEQPQAARGPQPIAVGILHSLSGTMAISETSLKDVALMALEEINASGGLLGRPVEPIVLDAESEWPLFQERARELLDEEEAQVIFGCWTSTSRKVVVPIVEERDSLLFYPVQYEGQEASRSVFYTGAVPNQQALPAVDYLMSPAGGGVRRFALVGTDYIYPRTTNRILTAYLLDKGIKPADITEHYAPLGERGYLPLVEGIRAFASGEKTAIISTINGDSNVHFYTELAAQGVTAKELPVMAFSVGEDEMRQMDPKLVKGHLAAWSYFMSLPGPENARFVARFKDYVERHHLPDRGRRVTSDPMVATYVGVHLWRRAVLQAGTTDAGAVREALGGMTFRGPSGFLLTMDKKNHHLQKPTFIGRSRGDGQFDVVWSSETPLPAEPWSRYLPESRDKVADFTFPWVCGDCEVARYEE